MSTAGMCVMCHVANQAPVWGLRPTRRGPHQLSVVEHLEGAGLGERVLHHAAAQPHARNDAKALVAQRLHHSASSAPAQLTLRLSAFRLSNWISSDGTSHVRESEVKWRYISACYTQLMMETDITSHYFQQQQH